MDHLQISQALNHIRPNAEYVLRGTELEWLDENQAEPTIEEIKLGFKEYVKIMEIVEAEKLEQEAKQRALKIAAYEKLGLSADEIEAILK